MADFGVARVQAETGVMTAETGTYRWMAPEVRLCLKINANIIICKAVLIRDNIMLYVPAVIFCIA